MSEVITINDTLELRAVEEQHVTPLHQLVLKNKSWLQQGEPQNSEKIVR